MRNTAIAISEETVLIERAKYGFLHMGKEELAEVLAVLSTKLVNSGVSYGYSKEERIEGARANYTENPIRDTFYINFSKHDNKLKHEVYKKLLDSMPEVSTHD